ncbi:MAG: phospholipase D-like domain-containing protein [Bacteroidota bacterium]
MTGIFNWTRSAANYNEENILLTEDIIVVKRFQSEFDKLWHELDFLS